MQEAVQTEVLPHGSSMHSIQLHPVGRRERSKREAVEDARQHHAVEVSRRVSASIRCRVREAPVQQRPPFLRSCTRQTKHTSEVFHSSRPRNGDTLERELRRVVPCSTSAVHHQSLHLGRREAHPLAGDVCLDGVEHTLNTSTHILYRCRAPRREHRNVIRVDGDTHIGRQSLGNVVPNVSQGDIE